MNRPLFLIFFAWAALLPAICADSDTDAAKVRASELRDTLVVMSRTKVVGQDAWDSLRVQIDSYQEEYGTGGPAAETLTALRKQQLAVAKRFPDSARYWALLEQLGENPILAVAEMAQEQRDVLRRLEDLKTKPVELKFTAADGTPVDLTAMRGKVVVVDFWASWCLECAFTAKKLASVYQELHGKGFEVVGVCLDEDRGAMEAFAKKYGMVWPHSFEGKKWDNPISRSYGINALPVFWLIDKKGMVVADREPKNLSREVRRLLAEP